MSDLYDKVYTWGNLHLAWRRASGATNPPCRAEAEKDGAAEIIK